ncbi:MAG: hypothetical protein P9L94_18080 [Candidatus Hinthialibacter antarcticus]|nr:hypothetical protein [Candidatus Hinthialibacter antarcticus]
MAQGIQAPSALQNFFNANSGLTSLFNRTSNNNNSSPLSLLTGNNGLSSQNGLSPLRQPNILRGLQDQTKSPADDEKKDKLDLSTFAKDAADGAIQQARTKPELGATNQIIVSKDGRFEASVDLKINSDGSFALDLAVRFAESSAAGIQSYTGTQQQVADETELIEGEEQPVPEDAETDEYSLEENPTDLSLSSFDAIAARQTTFEQIVSTRDFQAEIFFQESKAVALSAQQAQGDAIAGEYLGVSKQVAQEFTLNVSISGTDLSNFNAIAEELSQFDDTGTLGGFLEAARGVLTSDPGNLSSFVGATQGLIESARNHVGAQLNDFFTGLGDTFGEELDALGLGFASDFFENIGEDVNNDLNRFFDTTNQLFKNFGINTSADPESITTELLNKNLEQLREQQKEKLEESEEIDLSSPRNDSLLTPEPQAVELDVLV